jgi:membrane protein DedA with SNARE-associated domain
MDGAADRLLELFVAYGYLVVLVGVFLDNFGLPSSGDLVVFTAAALAAQGDLDLVWVALLAFTAAVASDNSLYWIGRGGARGLLKRFLDWRWIKKALAAGERYFDRHGPRTILIVRFLALVRTEVTFAAGVSAMEYRGFLFYDILGAAAWLAVILPLGYFLGAEVFDSYARILQGIFVLVVLVVGVRVGQWWWRRRWAKQRDAA